VTPSAVDIRQVEPGIVQVTMQDRVNRNTFSLELVGGLVRAFDSIRADSTYKVIVLTGYDSYFALGGTQEALLSLHQGKGRFSDSNLYSLALECEIPVISAMQGHGVGGGFVFGLFADFVVLSRESIYTTNFMKYGFTPGMGATYIVPKKLGISLGEELLITARNYRGAELEKRGVPFPVLARAQVLDYAYQLAREVAEKPRGALILLKRHLVAEIRSALPRVIEEEVEMHRQTFHEPEVANRIKTLFGK
jgi:polyketide biosynthesis enoyl-CoA hydratase PksI